MAKRIIKSADESQKDENQFELDEQTIDEVSNAEEFADVEISNEDIMDAVEAIDALADAVIEKADVEEKEIDADTLLDEVRNMVDDTHDEEPEEEEIEEAEIPEEIESSVVRVMVSEDGAIDLEQKPDEVYDSTVDGLECTMFDTTDDYSLDIDDTADSENTEDDVLVIGNSATKNYKKGYVKIKSSANKKAWSSAFKKVKKMVGSSKLTPAQWVIVSAIAKKEEEADKLKKKIECCLLKKIRSNKDMKAKFFNYIKSNFDEFDSEGAPESETKPEQTAEPKNNGFEEEGDPTNATSPETVDSTSGDPVEDPQKQVETESDDIVLPDEAIVVVDVPVTNSVRKVKLQRVRSSKEKGYNLYKVVSAKDMSALLNGRVIRSGKLGYCFRSTTQGVIACCAQFVENGKGQYKPVLSNGKVVLTRGAAEHPVFQNYEKIQIAKAIMNAKKEGIEQGKKMISSARRPVTARRESILNGKRTPVRRPVTSAARRPERTPVQRPAMSAARRPVRSSVMARQNRESIRQSVIAKKAQANERRAIESKAKLQKMHEAEERERIFQSSQTKMNEEKIAIKSSNTRNANTLNKLYGKMF